MSTTTQKSFIQWICQQSKRMSFRMRMDASKNISLTLNGSITIASSTFLVNFLEKSRHFSIFRLVFAKWLVCWLQKIINSHRLQQNYWNFAAKIWNSWKIAKIVMSIFAPMPTIGWSRHVICRIWFYGLIYKTMTFGLLTKVTSDWNFCWDLLDWKYDLLISLCSIEHC